ncbi:MAG: sugar transferase [Armatimonadota bacterium]|nr:MAG: sugar transferase [Armatimonadota bacterium]
MSRRRSLALLIIADACWVALSVRLALAVDSWRRSLPSMSLDAWYLLHWLTIVGIWLAALALCGAYDRRYLALRGRNLSLTMFGSAVATAASAVSFYLVPAWHMSRSAFVSLALTALLGVVLIRAVWLARERRVYLPEFLGVGDPELLAHVWRDLARVTGAACPLPVVSSNGDSPSRLPAGTVSCTPRSALETLERHGRELAVLSDGTIPSSQSARILTQASLNGSMVADVFTFYESYTGRAPIFRIEGKWIFRAQHHAPDHTAYFTKRLFDVVVTMLLLPLTIPVVAIAAVLIRLTSPGPAFFVQRRVGYRGHEFSLLKLRTMRPEASTAEEGIWTRPDDPRVTPLGRLLRATGIDELPQLWNVLRGDLSLVGPRPERPDVIRQLDSVLLPYMQRHVVPCGITGWAQIHRGSDVHFEDVLDKTRLDLYYARHFSLWLDAVILLRTFQMLLARARPAPSSLVTRETETTPAQRAVVYANGRSTG